MPRAARRTSAAARTAKSTTRTATSGTKTVITVPVARPRNPVTLAARKRVAGPHGPSRKAERQAAKIRLKKGQEPG